MSLANERARVRPLLARPPNDAGSVPASLPGSAEERRKIALKLLLDSLNEAKDNLNSPWIALSSLVTIALMLTLLIFIGEAVRDAFDPKKTLA